MDTRRIMRWAVYIVLVALVGVFLYSQLNLRQPQPDVVSLQALAKDIKEGNVNIYYDLVLAKRIEDSELYICNIHGSRWIEIDDHEDLKKAEEMFG